MGARVIGGILCVVITMLWWLDTSATTGQEPQKAFRISTLTSDWGYYAVAFAPDDQHVAVIASKGSSGAQGLEVTQEIQVWDFRATKLVCKKSLSQEKMPQGMAYQPQISLYDYTDSGSMILVVQNGHLLLLDARTLDEIREIDLATGNWPRTSEDSLGLSFVKSVAMDRSGDRAVVLLQWGRGEGGELRVYNLDSGELVRRWDYASLRTNDRNRDFGGADISADGRQVAASLIPFVIGEGALRSSEHNVFVLDIDSGSTIAAINTRYPAGHVRFAPTNPPVLLTVSADNFDRQRSTKDAIKIWDPLNGKLLRELDTPPEGVHFQVQVSSDGRIVLGYTGLEKFRGHWWLGQEETGSIDYNQFTLWNLTTGKIIAASPHIPSSEAHRSFRLSPMGDVVLLYPDTVGAKTLTFYELQR